MSNRRFGPVGIIDIGSNSVRFVAYAGAPRVPASLFNEKITAALGKGIARDGNLDEEAVRQTLKALGRFRQLGREMGLKKLHTVATAAVRDAANGAEFLKRVSALGLKPRLLSGAEEAEYSGLGVVSAIPKANGIVADLGGGSLELVGVARGSAGEGITLPLGVLRVGATPDAAVLHKAIAASVQKTRLNDAARGHGLYLVGGSFRALAQLDLKLAGHPLPIVHQHRFTLQRIDELAKLVESTPASTLKQRGGLASARVTALPAALAILRAMHDVLGPRRIVTSAFGLREGILYSELDSMTRQEDPLLAGALEVGERLGRFGDHGAALDTWMAPLFPDDGADAQRYRLAACLLGDIAWNAHPDFRAERAVDMAIHGDWVGIDAHGRALIGRALCTAFGGNGFGERLMALLKPGEAERASAWGKALRLAQRLSAGTEALLRRSSISMDAQKVTLSIARRNRDLYADAVERRLKQLGEALGREVEVIFP